MARLIDADALIKTFECMGLGENSFVERIFADGVYTVIENAPTIDATPVRRGEWVEVSYVYIGLKRYICNQCADEEYWKNRYLNTKENFCPNCGADMRPKKEKCV